MTEKEAREQVDVEVRSAIRAGHRKAGDIERELRASSAAKMLVKHRRPLNRVVDQSLQRLRRHGAIEFAPISREWKTR